MFCGKSKNLLRSKTKFYNIMDIISMLFGEKKKDKMS